MDWEQGVLGLRAMQGWRGNGAGSWDSLGMMGTVSPWGWMFFLSPLL